MQEQRDFRCCADETERLFTQDNECFLRLRDQEFLKGKTRSSASYTSASSTTALRWSQPTYKVNFLDYGPDAGAREEIRSVARLGRIRTV